MVEGSSPSLSAETTALLERDEHLAALRTSLEEVVGTGHGRLVLLRGEAGAGKTTVVRRFCDGPRARARVLWGGCEALFAPRALGPFLDIAETIGGQFAELLARGCTPHEALTAFLLELPRAAPTIVVLEDIHWADEATLDVLRLLGRRLDHTRALVVATYRDDELARSHPLRVVLGELVRAPGVGRIDVPRLSPDAVARLAGRSGIDPAALYARTGGNAFFVSEVLAAELEEIPSTVRDAVLARAWRLSETGRELLEAVAIFPPPVEVGVLDAVAGDAIGSLDDGIACGILVADAAGIAFRHEVARLVVAEATAPDRSAALHRRALAALAGSADDARLAHHAEAAGDADAVLRLAPGAARRAAALGAHRESAAQYERALRFGERLDDAQRAELLERLSWECMLVDRTDTAIATLREAIVLRRGLGQVRAEGQALEQLANVLWCPGRVAEAREATLAAVALLEQGEPARELAMACCRMAQLCMDSEDVAAAISWGTRGLDLATALGETQLVVHVLNSMGTARLLTGDPKGRAQLERSLAMARAAGLGDDVSRGLTHLAWTALRRHDHAAALASLEPALRHAADHGFEMRRGYLLAYRAQVDAALGRWDDAVELATQVLREPRRSRVPRIVALTTVARVRARRGEPEVAPLLEEALALADRGAELQAVVPVAVARAEAAWLDRDRDAVAEVTEAAFSLARDRRSRWAISVLLAWRARVGLAEERSGVEPEGPHALEIAGDWRAAAAGWDALGCPYEAALARGETDDPDAVRRAVEELRALGARRAEAIFARRLRERGERGAPRGPRRQTRANPFGLTGRELEVLALLAEGLRNADIATRLVLSAKTVDHHVSAILRKLGARTRGEATAIAIRDRLVHPPPASQDG